MSAPLSRALYRLAVLEHTPRPPCSGDGLSFDETTCDGLLQLQLIADVVEDISEARDGERASVAVAS